jgi:hypothetical protein
MKKLFIISILFVGVLFANEYQEWLKAQSNDFNTYKKTLDEEFLDMLKKDWKGFETLFEPTPYKKEKPKTLPKVEKVKKISKKEIESSPLVKIKKIVKKEERTPVPKPIVQEKEEGIKEEINFFNQELVFFFKKSFDFKFNEISKNELGESWKQLSKNDYKSFIKQINIYRNQYKLNDWALYKMLNILGTELYKDKNKANIFTWFIFTKMNFDTKIAYNKSEVFLLANVKESLYQVSFFKLNSKRYFVLSPEGRKSSLGKIYSYPHSYSSSLKRLSFDMNEKNINIYSDVKVRNLSFKFNEKEYVVKSSYSNDLIDFYKTFPQSQYDLYFNSKKSNELSNSLLVSLKTYLEGKSELEAVNFLLRFTQKSFDYQTDKQQFSYEKVMFPEETLHYSFSDCEDRSIMFAYLVESLLGLDVVGIKYKDHLSTAVAISSQINGSSIKYKDKVYTLSDPTYINANTGMVMPKYKNQTFSIIE